MWIIIGGLCRLHSIPLRNIRLNLDRKVQRLECLYCPFTIKYDIDTMIIKTDLFSYCQFPDETRKCDSSEIVWGKFFEMFWG